MDYVFIEIKAYFNTIWIILSFIVLYIIYRIGKFIKYRIIMNKIPGPKGLPYFGNIFDLLIPQDKLFELIRSYSLKYYPIYKLNAFHESVAFINSPEDIEILISGMKNLTKSLTYEPLRPWLREGLLLSTDQKWQNRRKLLTPTFHFTILSQFTKVFIEESEKIIDDIEKVANKEVDVLPIITKFTLKSICETAMGTKLDKDKSGDLYRDAIYKMGELTIEMIVKPWYHNPLCHILTNNFWEGRKLLRYLHKFTMDVIKSREKSFDRNVTEQNANLKSKRRLAMLDLLLMAKYKDNSIDDAGIQEEVDTFMFEGHDTTATSISFTLMLLACNKDVQDKAYEELKDVLGETSRQVTMDDVNEMKYMERVIKESLRVFPSVGIIGRMTSENILTHSGYVIPKDTMVLISIYDLHRNGNVYEDPEKFDPDRFLPEVTKTKHPYSYIPFSAGPRNCIGQKFAMLEMKTVLATILRNYELHPVDTPETIKLQIDIILRTTNGIKVKFVPRNK